MAVFDAYFISIIVTLICGVFSFLDSPPELINYKTDYCAIKCKGENHTMCEYQSRSSSCVGYEESYNPSFTFMMLYMHNDYRNKLANGSLPNQTLPKASNMRLLIWDRELSLIAHRWLSQCVMGHDTCRDTNIQIGQNLGFLINNEILGYDFEYVISKWLKEMEHVREKEVVSFNDERNQISNFSQLVWHSTHRVGCSDVIYWKNNRKIKAYACNYAPKGNIVGRSMYRIGDPATNCPPRTKSDDWFTHLCSADEDFDNIGDYDLFGSGSQHLHSFVLSIFLIFYVKVIVN